MEHAEPGQLDVIWSPEARADLRAVDRTRALDILHCLSRYLKDREGDVKKLRPPLREMRLRCGEYRVFFVETGRAAIEVTRVAHRRQAYR